jgi:undecaprenyl-diphosphatase
MEEWCGYYWIWEAICFAWFTKRELAKSKKAKWLFIILTSVLFLPASYFIYMEEQGNFHPITPGEAYRSAQLDRDELQHYIRKYSIRSIINFRGNRTGSNWYQEEIEVCKQFNCRHYDLSIPPDKSPSREQVKKLLHLFETAPRPVLLHCKSGADRTGLAAALWKISVDKEPKALARRQLSLRFGHFPIGPTSALDEFFKRWQPGQIYRTESHSSGSMKPFNCSRRKA